MRVILYKEVSEFVFDLLHARMCTKTPNRSGICWFDECFVNGETQRINMYPDIAESILDS